MLRMYHNQVQLLCDVELILYKVANFIPYQQSIFIYKKTVKTYCILFLFILCTRSHESYINFVLVRTADANTQQTLISYTAPLSVIYDLRTHNNRNGIIATKQLKNLK